MENNFNIPNLKEWYKAHADETSVSYKEFLKRVHRMSNPHSHANKKLVAQGLLSPPDPMPPRYRTPRKSKSSKSTTPFLAYDGEGRGKEGTYILLANRLGDEALNLNGLGSEICLDMLTSRYDNSFIRIFYGFGYDVNMILKDMPAEHWDHITEGIKWLGHRIQYMPGKIFRVDGYSYYDILPFFARSLVNALRDTLHEVDPVILKGKSLRADLFEQLSLDEIRDYNMHELTATEKLADHLREALNRIDLPLASWYGPGAIAKKMFQVYGIEKQTGEEIPPDCYFALENAYYGGRFENGILGKCGEVWEYDIHSAYPSILAELPYFRTWRHAVKYQAVAKFSVWKISWDFRQSSRRVDLQPFPFRERNGRLSFPLVGSSWIWQPEIIEALKIPGNEQYINISEGWIAETEGAPFDWVEKLYYQRMELKDAGDASEYAIKVGINSLYGKTAQRVGRADYFNIAWAGYITSATRAKLLQAYSLDPSGCIGFATDAIYSTRQLQGLEISSRLGAWEEKHYKGGGIFILPGLYVLSDGKVQKNRIRGLPNTDALTGLLDGFAKRPYNLPETLLRRFISNRLSNRAPNKYGEHRCQFVDVRYRLGVAEPRKRIYDFPRDSQYASRDNPLGINYGAILTQEIHSLPVIWGVNTLRSKEDGDFRLDPDWLFDHNKYGYFLEYPHFDIPKSVSRQFVDDDEQTKLSLIEQEGEVIADLEPEVIWDTVPVIDLYVQENINLDG